VVLLAQDETYRDDGTKVEGHATFYVPNAHVLRLAREHAEFIPAVSIHPSRPDAMVELERCLEAGARVLKLLPNVHNVECSAPRHRDFWKAMAAGGMMLLAHTGGEATLPVVSKQLESPEILRGPLECGVVCIAAHGAGRNTPWAAHHTPRLIRLMREYPHLYTDSSALTTLNRYDTLPELMGSGLHDRVLHGSDYPVPVMPWGPWLCDRYDLDAVLYLQGIENPLERDYQAKRLMGFGAASFARMGALIAGE
jgi:predicted TIM-barrel fold metal-dependent hydrolase